mmetsp:Transcript_13369/g.14806  ORF Transcript_13369/g.14806 Transcript_13369/m.14806 type:complete len:200 (-) Transcript_13369:52-651(-)
MDVDNEEDASENKEPAGEKSESEVEAPDAMQVDGEESQPEIQETNTEEVQQPTTEVPEETQETTPSPKTPQEATELIIALVDDKIKSQAAEESDPESEVEKAKPTGPVSPLPKMLRKRVSRKMLISKRHFHPINEHRCFCIWKVASEGRTDPSWVATAKAMQRLRATAQSEDTPNMEDLMIQFKSMDETLRLFESTTSK